MQLKRKIITVLFAISILPALLGALAVPVTAVGGSDFLPVPVVAGNTGQAPGAGTNGARVTASAVSIPNVVIGLDGQAGGDFIITETTAGVFNKTGGKVILGLPGNVWFSTIPKVEVTAGDLIISNCRSAEGDSQISFDIEAESTTPSTITVTGVSLKLDRSIAEGDVTLKIMGGAVVETQSFGGWTNSDFAARLTIAKVVTPAPAPIKNTTVFTIGSKEYSINGVQMVMDVAPFIDTNGRTLLPFRFAANAAGVSDSNILWHEADQSLTMISGNRIVGLVVGSPVMTINSVSLEMDTVPIIADPSRVMLPARAVAQALGCDIVWDAADRTVTVTKKD